MSALGFVSFVGALVALIALAAVGTTYGTRRAWLAVPRHLQSARDRQRRRAAARAAHPCNRPIRSGHAVSGMSTTPGVWYRAGGPFTSRSLPRAHVVRAPSATPWREVPLTGRPSSDPAADRLSAQALPDAPYAEFHAVMESARAIVRGTQSESDRQA